MNARLDAEGYPVPTCVWHPEREPIAVCVHCGRAICRECARTAAEGYICPECRPTGTVPEVAGMNPLAAWARLAAWLGLVPLVGIPGALGAIALAIFAIRRRGRTAGPLSPSPLISLMLSALGLAASGLAGWLIWGR